MNQQQQTAGGAGCRHAYYNSHRAAHDYRLPYMKRSMAPVSIYKTDNTYELMVFAPGRDKSNFQVQVTGENLVISYKPTIDTSDINWVRREYSRGGFERSFVTDDTMDTLNITAGYENGVLTISIPVKPKSERDIKEVKVN